MLNCSIDAGLDIELDHLALGVPPQSLMQRRFPALPEPEDLQDAILSEIGANLLRHSRPDMLGDLLGPVDVRRNLGNRLHDQIEVPD